MARIHFPEGFRFGASLDVGDAAGRVMRAGELALFRELPLDACRALPRWDRFQPTGKGPLAADLLDDLGGHVDRWLEAGLRPAIGLPGTRLPESLIGQGGWADRDTAGRLADLAAKLGRALADRVSDWVLLSDPHALVCGPHGPRGRPDAEQSLRALHVLNLAKAEAARGLRAERSDLRVGLLLDGRPCEPAGEVDADAEAALRWHRFRHLAFLAPARSGRYPAAFADELPWRELGLRNGDEERLQHPLDFLVLRPGPPLLVNAAPDDRLGIGAAPDETRRDDDPEAAARALPRLLEQLASEGDEREGPRPTLEIEAPDGHGQSAPGPADPSGPARDDDRTVVHRSILGSVRDAIEVGAPIEAYHAGPLYDPAPDDPSGLARVDFDEGTVTLKASGLWLAKVAGDRGFEV